MVLLLLGTISFQTSMEYQQFFLFRINLQNQKQGNLPASVHDTAATKSEASLLIKIPFLLQNERHFVFPSVTSVTGLLKSMHAVQDWIPQ